MATVVEHGRGDERRAVTRFLAAHENCASDFEIQRSEGPGANLVVLCNGCGERATYELGEGELTPVGTPEPDPIQTRRIGREELRRWLPAPAALPWWIPNAYILAVIGVGVAMIAFGLLRDQSGEPAELGGQAPQLAPPEQSPPAAQPAEAGGEKEGKAGAAKPELDPVTVLGRFTIGVPLGWVRGMSGGAVVFRPPGEAAELRVFLEPGAESRRRLSRQARAFLEREHPGARISPPERIELGGERAMRVVARYRGGEERAVVLSESGYSYLLLTRIEGAAPVSVERGAEAAVASFRAL